MRQKQSKATLMGRSLVIGAFIGVMLYAGITLYLGTLSATGAGATCLAAVLIVLLVLPRIGKGKRPDNDRSL
ncbi:hypothetical protein M0L20_16885 [Spirosoma sp. RP8]|uniref:DUF3098 domain-containing protein n=1 Tax=Spirosoma liriopis TaxID=2937440 RepID=A0ABT0HMZ5_9BACT|nr:hypothetical protein [Spirosoma liriopis]MCK8493544.1 hypothetical protein [Spirosoma liriopis]